MATELATAYISLVPSLKGGTRAIQKELSGVNTTGAGQAAGKRFGGGMVAAAGKFVGPLAAAFAGVKVFGFAKDAIGEASDLGESINALNVTYGESSKEVQKLGQDAADALGLSNVEFNNLAVRFSAFSKTIAGDGGDVAGTLDSITGRASDFASVMNLDVSEAAQVFQSGLAGETEPLRRFGIDLSAASVQAYAMANGIGDGTGALTEAEKVQARYGSLMEQTSATQGDFANTSGDLANSQRILGARWDNLKAQLGQALIPLVTKFVGWLSTAIPVISGVATEVGEFFSSISNGSGTMSGASGLFASFREVFASIGQVWRETVQPALTELWGTFQEDVMPAVRDFWTMFQRDVLPELKQFASFVAQNIVPALGDMVAKGIELWAAYQSKVLPIITKVGGWIIKYLVPYVSQHIQTVWEAIEVAVDWGTAIGEQVGKVIQWFKDMPGNVKTAMGNLADRITAPFKTAFNAIASMWNNTVGTIALSPPGWVKALGVGSWSVPNIPMLASGGTATASGWSVVGENGPEMRYMPRGASVVPLDRMDVFAGGNNAGGLQPGQSLALVLDDGTTLTGHVATIAAKVQSGSIKAQQFGKAALA